MDPGEILARAAKTGPLYNATLTGNLLACCTKGMVSILALSGAERRATSIKLLIALASPAEEKRRKVSWNDPSFVKLVFSIGVMQPFVSE